MTIAWLMISDALIQNIIKERQKNIKHQLLVSGSGLLAYWMSNYIGDILFQAIPAVCGIIGVHAFGIDVPDVEFLFLSMILANPAFIYAISFLFEKDETGSLIIKMIYFVVGIIAPIAISILQVVNETTKNVAEIMRWFFFPIPIFSMTFGYMSIAQRSIIQIVNKLPVAPGPLSNSVAGPSLWFLLGAVVLYWFIVVMFEYKVFDILCCRRGNRNQNADSAGRKSSVFNAHQEVDDEDIVEEASRVKNSNPPNVPVRVQDVSKNYGSVKAVKNLSFGLEYGECFALLGISGAGKTSVFKCLTGETYPTTGQLSINGHDVTTASGFEQARRQIGYCPQFDAIFEGLTVVEHL